MADNYEFTEEELLGNPEFIEIATWLVSEMFDCVDSFCKKASIEGLESLMEMESIAFSFRCGGSKFDGKYVGVGIGANPYGVSCVGKTIILLIRRYLAKRQKDFEKEGFISPKSSSGLANIHDEIYVTKEGVYKLSYAEGEGWSLEKRTEDLNIHPGFPGVIN